MSANLNVGCKPNEVRAGIAAQAQGRQAWNCSRPACGADFRLFGALLLWLVLLLPLAALGQRQPENRPAPLSPAEAASEGRKLVAELHAQKPQDATNTGVLKVRNAEGQEREIPVKIVVASTPTNWFSLYETLPSPTAPGGVILKVIRTEGRPNEYLLTEPGAGGTRKLTGDQTMVPFAGSDFWVADLGLEFLDWPKQLLVRKELRLSQTCDVLESINPKPEPGAYSKVVSWIDVHNYGVLHADAYDAQGRIWKQFGPTELQKIKGERQVKQVEMRNRKARTRSWLDFNPGA